MVSPRSSPTSAAYAPPSPQDTRMNAFTFGNRLEKPTLRLSPSNSYSNSGNNSEEDLGPTSVGSGLPKRSPYSGHFNWGSAANNSFDNLVSPSSSSPNLAHAANDSNSVDTTPKISVAVRGRRASAVNGNDPTAPPPVQIVSLRSAKTRMSFGGGDFGFRRASTISGTSAPTRDSNTSMVPTVGSFKPQHRRESSTFSFANKGSRRSSSWGGLGRRKSQSNESEYSLDQDQSARSSDHEPQGFIYHGFTLTDMSAPKPRQPSISIPTLDDAASPNLDFQESPTQVWSVPQTNGTGRSPKPNYVQRSSPALVDPLAGPSEPSPPRSPANTSPRVDVPTSPVIEEPPAAATPTPKAEKRRSALARLFGKKKKATIEMISAPVFNTFIKKAPLSPPEDRALVFDDWKNHVPLPAPALKVLKEQQGNQHQLPPLPLQPAPELAPAQRDSGAYEEEEDIPPMSPYDTAPAPADPPQLSPPRFSKEIAWGEERFEDPKPEPARNAGLGFDLNQTLQGYKDVDEYDEDPRQRMNSVYQVNSIYNPSFGHQAKQPSTSTTDTSQTDESYDYLLDYYGDEDEADGAADDLGIAPGLLKQTADIGVAALKRDEDEDDEVDFEDTKNPFTRQTPPNTPMKSANQVSPYGTVSAASTPPSNIPQITFNSAGMHRHKRNESGSNLHALVEEDEVSNASNSPDIERTIFSGSVSYGPGETADFGGPFGMKSRGHLGSPLFEQDEFGMQRSGSANSISPDEDAVVNLNSNSNRRKSMRPAGVKSPGAGGLTINSRSLSPFQAYDGELSPTATPSQKFSRPEGGFDMYSSSPPSPSTRVSPPSPRYNHKRSPPASPNLTPPPPPPKDSQIKSTRQMLEPQMLDPAGYIDPRMSGHFVIPMLFPAEDDEDDEEGTPTMEKGRYSYNQNNDGDGDSESAYSSDGNRDSEETADTYTSSANSSRRLSNGLSYAHGAFTSPAWSRDIPPLRHPGRKGSIAGW